ncbi:hypothetical protein SPRG_13986 [Saprolegnia parasitica CBS 223.65]|uniref:Uncharacterized protein n=1 Tax=Saprolegnia parasitica (strain CBS 223.65) TaxID=695850 RepID=A0A067BQC5_SAPPC|nr:hypothetical protein SPRG_13986 [Saprolegnia parasitica CBS 223.65]KDO20468.1 hypothetical protein SPRG_13986 [Saprolegnia parasitica CBS 223.65]|eukprot:XP_012208795.1 hypothetical protein SPRG_13986 [Saprolegnia parasitica CBS 223.65]
MANSSAIFDNPSILLSASYPMGYTANLTSTISSCYDKLGVSYVGWQQFTSALRCYMNTSCPITEDVSSTRMVSLQSNYATQMIQMQTYESVTLWFSVKGMTVGALYNVGAYGYGYTSLESQLWFLSNFSSSISAYSYTSSMSNLWTLELTSKTLWVVPYDLKFFQASAIRPPSMDIFMPNNMSTMCDQCRAFLHKYCGPDPSCQQLMTNFQRNINQTVLNLINAGNGSSVDVSDIIARSVPAGTPARAVSVFGLYHSCLSLYRCPLVKMPPGAPVVPILDASEEMHMVMIYNTSAKFNLTLTYPALNADCVFRLLEYGTVLLDMYFPHSILPLSLPDIASNQANYTYQQTASPVIQLIPANTTVQDSSVEIVQSPACNRCQQHIAACNLSPFGCHAVQWCVENGKATQQMRNGPFSPTTAGLYATRSLNVSSCLTNVSLAAAAPYLAASSCYATNKCPVGATLSQILADRSLVTAVTPGYQKILVSGDEKYFVSGGNYFLATVSLEFRLLGSSSSVLADQLQAMFKSFGTVDVSFGTVDLWTSQETNTMWYIQISYYNYTGPLPTITIATSGLLSASLVNTQHPSQYYEVVPLSAVKFGFPYQANGAAPTPAPMTTSPTPLPMYGSIVFPSGGQTTNTSMVNATVPNAKMTMALVTNATMFMANNMTSTASTPLRAASVLGLYLSCLARDWCPLVKVPPGAFDAPIIFPRDEIHVVTIYNTSASFNLSVTYPALDVTLNMSSSMSSADITYALASQWNVSMPPTASLSSTCTRCMQRIYDCNYNRFGCGNVLPCADADNATEQVRNGSFSVASAGLYSTWSINVSSCLANVPLARAATYLVRSSCLAANMCPMNATLSQILAGRSLVISVTPGVHMILVTGPLTALVSVDVHLLGTHLGRIDYISLYSSPSQLSSQLQAVFGALGTVNMATFQKADTMWYIRIVYADYVGPLPTLSFATAASVTASVISANSPSQNYQVVPLSAVKFGFPYQANGATPASMTMSPLPMYGSIVFPSGGPTTNTPMVNATMPSAPVKVMTTVCEQCKAYLQANCRWDADCATLSTSFRAAINVNVSSLLYDVSPSSPKSISSVLLGAQTPFATTSLKSMTPFALYYSCMSHYQCTLNTTMVNGSPKNVVLSTTPEVHVVSVNMIESGRNVTISYPTLNASLIVTKTSTVLGAWNVSWQSPWAVSLDPAVVVTCVNSCSVMQTIVTFKNLAIPVPLPNATTALYTCTVTRAGLGSQTLSLLPSTTVTNSALVLSEKCSFCVSQFSICAANAECAKILSCWRTNALIASTLDALQASPTLSSVNATSNATICFGNPLNANAFYFAFPMSCLLRNACPVAADLSLTATIASILANRMIVPTATTAIQTIYLDRTSSVTLTLTSWNSQNNDVAVSFATPIAEVAAFVQAVVSGMGQVNASSVATGPTSWALTLTYTNYIAPLPTITVYGGTATVSSVPASWLYKVVPFNVTAFGFPYKTNNVMLPTSALSTKCQACASLAAQCAMSTPCASIVSCVGNQTTGNFTTALATGAMQTPIEYTSAVATCTANVAHTAWYMYAQVMACNEVNACPLLSTTASVAAGRMLTRYSYTATQKIQVNAIANVNINVKFAIGSTFVGALLNVTSANSTSNLTAQVQTIFAGIATVTAMTWSDAAAWYLGLTYANYYGPPLALTIYGSHNATMTLDQGSRQFVTVVPYNALSYAPY